MTKYMAKNIAMNGDNTRFTTARYLMRSLSAVTS